jgi:hypothetical protein
MHTHAVTDEDSRAERLRRAREAEANDPAEAAPEEIEFALEWLPTGAGSLRGDLVASNVSNRAFRLTGKPAIKPVSDDGSLPTSRHRVSGERRIPSHIVLQPGQRASTSVAWSYRDEGFSSHAVIVGWAGGEKTVPTSGATYPPSVEATGWRHPETGEPMPMTTSSGWFRLLDDSDGG